MSKFPVGWAIANLGDCADWYSGGTPNTSNLAFWNGDIPWITSSSLRDFYLSHSERQLTRLGLDNGSRLMPENAIIFVVRGMSLKTEFRLGIARKPVAFGQDCKALIAKSGIDPWYLAYAIRSKSNEILGMVDEAGHGTGRLQTEVLKQLEIPIPPLIEQEEIARSMRLLDDKIELNRRMNHTLESMARAVFRQWFVENEENNWEEKSLDEIANFLNGLALQKFPAGDDGDYLPVIKIAQLRKNDTKDADKASTNIPAEYIIEDGDILFSWSGSLEVVIWCGGKGALNQHLFKVTSDKYPKWFYYLWTKHHLPEFQAIAAGKATTMGHIQRHHLRDAKVLVPGDKELQEMDKLMSPILDKIIVNEKESRTLASLRDSLLPKLMRGEIRVRS